MFSSVSAEPGGNTTFDPGESDQRTVIFQPGTEFRGQSGFSFAVEDDAGNRVTGRVRFTLLGPENQPPVAADDAITLEAGLPVTYDVANLFEDPDPGDTLTYTIGAAGSDQLTVTQNGTVITLQAPQTAAAFSTTISVDAADSDGEAATPGATLTINVTETTIGPPIPTNDGPTRALSGDPITIDLVTNDLDQLGEGLQLTNVFVRNGAAVGTATFTDAEATFTPAVVFSGEAVIEYTVTDGRDGAGGTATGLWTVNVIGIPDQPTGLDAEAVGPRTVALNWNAPANNGAEITSYNLDTDGQVIPLSLIHI